ncbi:hypothetical protein [Pedobacter miscanthi]|jgi:hypothetical protein|uniref:hypothetical protein n=1 Tax=Pedobacter miscanthi TaxID=2259170 RepID=UPI002931DA7D|nr:hypothetical protein [Pedobacter miscanthi]
MMNNLISIQSVFNHINPGGKDAREALPNAIESLFLNDSPDHQTVQTMADSSADFSLSDDEDDDDSGFCCPCCLPR